MLQTLLYQKLAESQLTHKDFAKYLGIDPSELTRTLRKNRTPSHTIMRAIARRFPEAKPIMVDMIFGKAPDYKALGSKGGKATNDKHKGKHAEWGRMGKGISRIRL
jgi:transcriptional regulator with XRE-family HTH domain